MTPKVNEELIQLYTNLITATDVYKHAKEVAEVANRSETATLNELNKAQAAFDAFLAKMKKEAPRQSDWKSSERVGVAEKE